MSVLASPTTHSPLLRNGYALVFNVMATAGVGALFWLLAARLYSLEDVGVSAALISAMAFLSKLAQLNMGNALNRFVPAAGARTGRLIAGAYLLCSIAAGAAAVVFVVGVGIWAPELTVLRDSATFSAAFVLATMVWTVFVLQDAALTGLRRATWVPIENLAYGVAKIAVLVALVSIAPGIGIFAAWTLPLAALLVVVNRLVFARAVPAHKATNRDDDIGAGTVARFAGADFLGSLGWILIVDLLPVIVFSIAGAEANAYFFLAWTIAYTLYLIGRSTGMSLIAEASLEPARLHVYARRVLGRTLIIILPLTAGLVVAAPVVLGVFGSDYAREASTVLRLLSLSSIPASVIAVYAAMARVERRLVAMGVVHGVLGILVTGTSIALIDPLGIAGAGWACLGAMTVVAAALLATRMRSVWLPVALEHRLTQTLLSRVEQMRKHPSDPVVTDTLARIASGLGELSGSQIAGRPATDPGVAAAVLGSPGQPGMILKVPEHDAAIPGVLHEATALEALRSDPRIEAWAHLTPRLIASNRSTEQVFTVQEQLAGVDGRTATSLGLDLDEAMIRTAEAVATLHRRTASTCPLDDALQRRLVDTRLDTAMYGARGSLPRRYSAAIERLRQRLHEEMSGRETVTAWTHGDLWLGNVLFGMGGEVSGIVDWGGWVPDGIPGIDLAHLVLTTRTMRDGASLGTVMCRYLDNPWLSAAEKQVMALDAGSTSAPSEPVLFLLAWLHHLASNLTKSGRYESSWLWAARNIEPVLVSL